MRSSCAISRRKRRICWLVTSMPPCFTLIWRHSRRHNNWRRRVSASEPGLVVPVAIIGNSSAHVMVLRLKLDKENAKRKSVPGRYIYAGSRRTKVERWHIDQLTKTGACGAWIFPGCSECDLVDINSSLPVPIIGFGSTDCKRCHSHLLGPISIRQLTHQYSQGCPPGPRLPVRIEG